MSDKPEQQPIDPNAVSESGTALAPAKRAAPPERKPKKLPPYKVLLHNDEVNSFDHVISAIMRLVGSTFEDATVKALEAHEKGVALITVTHQERAELFAEQFASLSLTVTIEPA
ncbi:MAG: ATP-dependent Clp protease adaptor ClpS [Phycisphaerae bacterium]|nr:ATP-dependent Clp protease adaptor ClpS [Phycisphaerae bacterium]